MWRGGETLRPALFFCGVCADVVRRASYNGPMRMLILVGVAIGAIFLAMPWIKSHLDDAGFRQDIAFTPGLVAGRAGANAAVVANAVKARAKDRGITLPEDGLKVSVSAGHKGSYRVAGGIMTAVGPAGSAVQDVTVNVSYDQPLFRFFKRHVETEVDTSAPGNGPASSYPLQPAPDAPPQ
jgi:hypothetical protein